MEAGESADAGWGAEVEEGLGVAVEPPCSCKPEVRLKQAVLIEEVEPVEPLGLVGDPWNSVVHRVRDLTVLFAPCACCGDPFETWLRMAAALG